MSSKREEGLALVLSVFLEMHATVWAELKMAGLTTKQHDNDYFEFCEIVKELHKKHGYDFYKEIDKTIPNNSWIPLCRKNIHIISLEEINKGVHH